MNCKRSGFLGVFCSIRTLTVLYMMLLEMGNSIYEEVKNSVKEKVCFSDIIGKRYEFSIGKTDFNLRSNQDVLVTSFSIIMAWVKISDLGL
jgi:hypothetical protein